MTYILYLIGAVLILFGLYCLYRAKKRRFDRTNEFGVQQFPSYARKLKSQFGDIALMVLAIFLIGAGAIAIVTADKDAWGEAIFTAIVLWGFASMFFRKPK